LLHHQDKVQKAFVWNVQNSPEFQSIYQQSEQAKQIWMRIMSQSPVTLPFAKAMEESNSGQIMEEFYDQLNSLSMDESILKQEANVHAKYLLTNYKALRMIQYPEDEMLPELAELVSTIRPRPTSVRVTGRLKQRFYDISKDPEEFTAMEAYNRFDLEKMHVLTNYAANLIDDTEAEIQQIKTDVFAMTRVSERLPQSSSLFLEIVTELEFLERELGRKIMYARNYNRILVLFNNIYQKKTKLGRELKKKELEACYDKLELKRILPHHEEVRASEMLDDEEAFQKFKLRPDPDFPNLQRLFKTLEIPQVPNYVKLKY
jgi:hypothetical protein